MKHTVIALALSVFVLAPQAGDTDNATNAVGMNTSVISDWDISKPLVDLIKLARPWETPDGRKARVDAHGWPLEDAQAVIWSDLPRMNGTCKLWFSGQGQPFVDWASGHVANQIYDPASNTTMADVIADSAEKTSMILGFRNTNGGVKNVRLIRPGYSSSETFTAPYKTALSKGSVIRLLDFSNGIDSREMNWSDRKLPSYYSQSTSPDDPVQGGRCMGIRYSAVQRAETRRMDQCSSASQ